MNGKTRPSAPDASATIPLFTGYPDVMDVKQVMAALNICRSGVYTLLRSGALHCITIGRVYKIPKVSLINYVSGKNEVI